MNPSHSIWMQSHICKVFCTLKHLPIFIQQNPSKKMIQQPLIMGGPHNLVYLVLGLPLTLIKRELVCYKLS